jgi:hypothetical protein
LTNRFLRHFLRNADQAWGFGIRLRRLYLVASRLPFDSIRVVRVHGEAMDGKIDSGVCARYSMFLRANTACTSSALS